MPDNLQPGSHLSPDQLSAFAENVLPSHERFAALAHMADCPVCRQSVFLIQQSDPSLAAAPALETPRRGWFTFPQIFVAASAALACALILAFIVHQHFTGLSSPPITTAQLPIPPALPTPTPAPTLAQTPSPKPAAPAQLSTASTLPPKPSPAKIAPAELIPRPQPAYASRPAMLGAANSGTSSGYASKSIELGKQSLAYDSVARSSASTQLAPETPITSFGMSPTPPATTLSSRANQTYSDKSAQASPAPSSATSPALPSVTITDSPPVLETSDQLLPPASRASTASAVPVAIPQLLQLPSKKPIASQLNSGLRTLALDTAGALFLSIDHGQHWSAVTQQWSGKAVRLSFAASPARLYQVQPQQSQAASTGMAQQSQQAPIPTAGFELTTSTGVVFISTDGLTWHAR